MQALYRSTGGVPPAPPRPVIVLVVRDSLRGLTNSDEVCPPERSGSVGKHE